MKKYLLLISMFFCLGNIAKAEVTDISQYENIVYAENATGSAGTSVTLSVKLNNTESVTGFQFDLVLPEGITVAKDDEGFYLIELSTERTTAKKTDYFNSALQTDGSIRVMCSSTKSIAFDGTSGEVATITLNIDNSVADGDYPIILKDEVGSYSNAQGFKIDAVESKLTVGDIAVNYDDGYSVQIAPIEFNEDIDGLEFTVGTQNALTNVSFDIEFPENIGANQLYTVSKGLGTTTATTSIDDDEAGNVSVTVTRKNTKTISDGATVAKLEIGYDGDILSPGIYPLNIKNVKMTDTDGNEYNAAPVTSYIKIGTPTNSSLTLVGHVTEDVNSALATETGLSSVDMSGVTSIEGTLKLLDGRNFIAPKKAVDVEKVEYVRSMTSEWGTVCIPYDLTSDETIQYYQLVGVSESSMTFEPTSSVAAGTPAVFKLLSGTSADMTAENVSISAGNKEWDGTVSGKSWVMRGTMSTINLDPTTVENDIYYIADNKFWHANKSFDVPAFCGWFETEKTTSLAKMYDIATWEDTPTSINYVEKADGTVDVIFDITGRKLSGAKRGINIINGKKILVK